MSVVFNRDTYDLPMLLFEEMAVERGYVTWRHATWRTSAPHLDALSEVAFRCAGLNGERSARLERGTSVALVNLDRHGRGDLWGCRRRRVAAGTA